MKYSNIVLALEEIKGNEETLKLASKFASENSSKLTIIQVVEPLPLALKNVLKSEYKLNFKKHLENQEKEEKRLIEDIILEYNIESEVVLLEGEVSFEIIKHCVSQNADLLIIKDQKKSAIKEKVFGSNTFRILRKCPCPVWVISDSLLDNSTQKVLATVDIMNEELEAIEQNKEIITVAYNFAKLFNGKVHVINTYRHFGEELQKGHWGLGVDEAQEIDNQLQITHQEKLEALVKQISFEGVEVVVETIKGDASLVIQDLANKEDINLVVMGTVSRTGISGFIMGNTAEKALRFMSESVVAIKPSSFKCPLDFNNR